LDLNLTQPKKQDYERVVHKFLESDSPPHTQIWISGAWGLEVRPTYLQPQMLAHGRASHTYNTTTSHITGCSEVDFCACRIPIPHPSNLYESHIIINQGRSLFKPLIHLNHYTDLSVGVQWSTAHHWTSSMSWIHNHSQNLSFFNLPTLKDPLYLLHNLSLFWTPVNVKSPINIFIPTYYWTYGTWSLEDGTSMGGQLTGCLTTNLW